MNKVGKQSLFCIGAFIFGYACYWALIFGIAYWLHGDEPTEPMGEYVFFHMKIFIVLEGVFLTGFLIFMFEWTNFFKTRKIWMYFLWGLLHNFYGKFMSPIFRKIVVWENMYDSAFSLKFGFSWAALGAISLFIGFCVFRVFDRFMWKKNHVG